MPVEPGQRLSHYRLVQKIGEGGMGIVYQAQDESLNRTVALKVLPPGALHDKESRKRFRKEALSLSRLNHPNIETIHHFESDRGIDFLVMEYVPGQGLDEKLAAGPLPEEEIVRLGGQLAAGLAAAHAEGVVHRDLKPSNLRLTGDGRLKILDFGLAKWLQDPDRFGTTLSGTEGGAGTLPYMAPEQLRKEGIDPRSDIYALGAVLYEMATGRRPFPQTSPPRLIEAILNEAPVPPSALNPRISPELERGILKALDKNPELRYQAAREVEVDLERLGSRASTGGSPHARTRAGRRGMILVGVALMAGLGLVAGLNSGRVRESFLRRLGHGRISSLAVLPLANLSGDPGQEYFAEGMTDELITSLAQIRSLRVISRTSVMQYKGTQKKLPVIAKELGVQAVLEGSVRRMGGRVRVTVQLVEAATDGHLWANSFERENKDVLFLQADMSQAIAGAIQAVLTPAEKTRLGRTRRVAPEAYEAYLRARSHGGKFTVEETRKALDYLQDAVTQQPDYALAYTEMARDYWYLGQPLGGMPYAEAMEKARTAATKAIELDETLGEAYSALGTIRLWYDWDSIEAEKLLNRAIDLTPGDAFTHFEYGFLLAATGRPEAAIAEGRRAVEISPLELTVRVALAEILLFARRHNEAIEECRKMIALDPGFPRAYGELAWNYESMGRYDSAAVARARLWALAGKPERGEAIKRAYAASGKEGYFRLLIGQFGRSSWALAQIGRSDEAIAALEQDYSHRRGELIFLEVIPFLDPLRPDPRFQDIVRRVGIRPR